METYTRFKNVVETGCYWLVTAELLGLVLLVAWSMGTGLTGWAEVKWYLTEVVGRTFGVLVLAGVFLLGLRAVAVRSDRRKWTGRR